MLSDILPTGFECGVLNGQVKPGDTVAIVGAGPIGLAALLTAQFYSPAEIVMIDLDENRLQVARTLGATKDVSSADGKAVQKVMDLTGGAGVDVAIEAVGIPATFDICQEILAPGRPSGQRGRPWQARAAPPGEAVGPQHHPDHAAGRHRDHAHAPQGGAVGTASAQEARDASLRAGAR